MMKKPGHMAPLWRDGALIPKFPRGVHRVDRMQGPRDKNDEFQLKGDDGSTSWWLFFSFLIFFSFLEGEGAVMNRGCAQRRSALCMRVLASAAGTHVGW